ncbi:sensor histidine kinase [Pseudoblastomonas halimionae]|uniref:histidine kinase n=1 Tax=Alteriqipengyuania halimionae TaxID=1926630 RepID=A0A6I4U8J2_9SPHN|nr:PAS domain-containing protein [Alteriqipengyuania halimionae]MXP11163.1 PAS domain-containing protein [Alteriqipengyuania halimionae]
MAHDDSNAAPAALYDLPDTGREDLRLTVLSHYEFDALQDDPELQRITAFASKLCGTKMSFVSLVDDERQHFIAREGSDMNGTPREQSFCAHAMHGREIMEVVDAREDDRFRDNPLVTPEDGIRYYAGAPLVSDEGLALGSLCVIDGAVRTEALSDFQREGLEVLAQAVMRRLKARRQILEREHRTAVVADHMPDILWSCDSDDNFDYYNRRWTEFTGIEPPAHASGWAPLLHPDEKRSAIEKWTAATKSGEPYESEYRFLSKTGEWRWVITRALPLKGVDGKVRRWFGTITDIHDQREASEQRDLLARELSHRIKNIFAVIGGLAQLKSRDHPEAKEFATSFGEAISALNRAHDYVRPGASASRDTLHGLLRELAQPYTVNGRDSVVIEGEDVPIDPKSATPLALVFHELATNAAKYGALNAGTGTVRIASRIDGENVEVDWIEEGGADASDPGEDGFGTRLITMTVQGQLGGKLERDFGKDGFRAQIELPLAAL